MNDSKVSWIHISDPQFRHARNYDEYMFWANLLRDVENLIDTGMEPSFVAVTGDVAYTGSLEEYDLAAQSLLQLLSVLRLRPDRLFIVPGNHDIDRSTASTLARLVSESVDSPDIVERIMNSDLDFEILMRPFDNFRQFIARISDDDPHAKRNSSLYFVRHLEFHGKRVAILGFNSAWLSGSDHDLGKLILGESTVKSALQEATGANLVLALMHHPFRYMREFDRAVVQPLLLHSTDFVLYSQARSTEVISQQIGFRAVELASCLRYKLRDEDHVGTYNVVEYDFSQDTATAYFRRYIDRQGGFWAPDVLAHPNAPSGTLALQLNSPGPSPSVMPSIDLQTSSKIHIKTLELLNYRCFGGQDIEFADDFTVLIGNNASGKTAILEALVLGVGTFFHGFKGFDPLPILDDHVRVKSHVFGDTVTFEHQYPVEISCCMQWGKLELSWLRERYREGEPKSDENIREIVTLAKNLSYQVQEGSEVVLPLLAYYSTGRLWRTPRQLSDSSDRPRSRLSGYDNCLDPASHFNGFTQWMKRQELLGLQERRPNKSYEAVKTAVIRCMEGLKDIFYSVNEDEIVSRFASGQQLPFRMLSEGTRNMMAMVADIAYRAVVLNPQFGERAATQTPGIVLIDELDLHLHPKWQQAVVSQLGRAFPKLQFIATTHSPLIVGGLRPDQIVHLQRDELHRDETVVSNLRESMVGWRADQVLTSWAFGLESTRDHETQELISTYSRLSVRQDLSRSEQHLLEEAAQKLSLRLPTSAERKEAREAFELIRRATMSEWLNKSPEERERLLSEVYSQVLEGIMGQWRPE